MGHSKDPASSLRLNLQRRRCDAPSPHSARTPSPRICLHSSPISHNSSRRNLHSRSHSRTFASHFIDRKHTSRTENLVKAGKFGGI